jgi:hypothetical protein
MNLVGYSDSEGSDNEAPPVPKAAAKPASKPAQKLVDPGTNKIKVNLSSLTSGADEEAERDARPAKRQRTGGGLNINAFLPPPKQPSKPLSNESIIAEKKTPGKGLGKGVNLKTGAEPAFTRSEASSALDLDGEPKDIKEVIAELRRSRHLANPAPAKEDTAAKNATLPTEQEVKLVGNPMRFKPKSVARNAPKKKIPGALRVTAAPATIATQASQTKATGPATFERASVTETVPWAKSKVSLFSISKEDVGSSAQPVTDEYEPALVEDAATAEVQDEAFETYAYTSTSQSYEAPSASVQSAPGVEGLNLSAADMRQLFGRKAGKRGEMPDLSSVKMVNFNADVEYAANEELRAKGETVQHNPVRAIAPGKHTLKQLVNAAATQKDALEEHFAQGKRSQREAGSRYGW